jgi:hypothetical protein
MATRKDTRSKSKWWVSLIRNNSWFSFRYWWFNYLVWAALISLLLFFILKKSPSDSVFNCSQKESIDSLVVNIRRDLDQCCNCRKEIIPPLDSNEIFLPADYIIITYQFDASGGSDLDTRTKIISPIAGRNLGYCYPKPTEGLHWGGDNKGYGVESVYIDVNHFEENEVIEVLCKAWWYERKDSGKMSLDIRAYKGGTMRLEKEKFQFINIGGEEVGNVISFPHKINMFHNSCGNAEKIGILKFDRATQILSFDK